METGQLKHLSEHVERGKGDYRIFRSLIGGSHFVPGGKSGAGRPQTSPYGAPLKWLTTKRWQRFMFGSEEWKPVCSSRRSLNSQKLKSPGVRQMTCSVGM